MSWIPCTSHCIYQHDGICTLDCVSAAGIPGHGSDCVHYIPKLSASGLPSEPHQYSEPESVPNLEAPSQTSGME